MAKATAKKKATPRSNAKRSNAKPTATSMASKVAGLPPGMTALEGSFAPNWDVEKDPEIRGIWGEPRTVTLQQGRKTVERRCAELTSENGDRFTVWESAALTALFEQVEPGADVYIRFDGLGKAKKGQNAPKLFTVAVA